MLVGLTLGLASGAALADDASTVRGQVSATEQEADEGYFALGADTMIVVKPQSALHQWLRLHTGDHVRLTITPENVTQK